MGHEIIRVVVNRENIPRKNANNAIAIDIIRKTKTDIMY